MMYRMYIAITIIAVMLFVAFSLYKEYSWYKLISNKQKKFNLSRVMNTSKRHYYALEVCSVCLVACMFLPSNLNQEKNEPQSLILMPSTTGITERSIESASNGIPEDENNNIDVALLTTGNSINQIEKIKYLYSYDEEYFESVDLVKVNDNAIDVSSVEVTYAIVNNYFTPIEEKIEETDYLYIVTTSNEEVIEISVSDIETNLYVCYLNNNECYKKLDSE